MRRFGVFRAICLFLILFLCTPKFEATASNPPSRKQRIQTLYDSLVANNVIFPVTITAIAIQETGFLECRNCPMKHNNFMGFRKRRYLKFASIGETIRFVNTWHQKRYYPWKAKNPNKNYHQFLRSIHYAGKMRTFLRNVKKYEKWVAANIDIYKAPNMACNADSMQYQNSIQQGDCLD